MHLETKKQLRQENAEFFSRRSCFDFIIMKCNGNNT